MNQNTQSEHLNLKESAILVGKSISTIRQLTQKKKISSLTSSGKYGPEIRINKTDLLEFYKNRTPNNIPNNMPPDSARENVVIGRDRKSYSKKNKAYSPAPNNTPNSTPHKTSNNNNIIHELVSVLKEQLTTKDREIQELHILLKGFNDRLLLIEDDKPELINTTVITQEPLQNTITAGIQDSRDDKIESLKKELETTKKQLKRLRQEKTKPRNFLEWLWDKINKIH